MSSLNPIDVAFMFVERINRQDPDDLAELMPEDHTFFDLAGDTEQGREVLRDGCSWCFLTCPEYMIHIAEVYQVENTAILMGRTTGSHLQLPRPIQFKDPVIWTAKIENDLVAECRICADTDQAREPLG